MPENLVAIFLLAAGTVPLTTVFLWCFGVVSHSTLVAGVASFGMYVVFVIGLLCGLRLP